MDDGCQCKRIGSVKEQNTLPVMDNNRRAVRRDTLYRPIIDILLCIKSLISLLDISRA